MLRRADQDLNRRRFIQSGLSAAAGLTANCRARAFAQTATPMASPEIVSSGVKLVPYVDPLPLPPMLRASAGQTLDMQMRQFRRKLHRDLPPTTLWGYNGFSPGPTIETRRGVPIEVRWSNHLPAKHLLPIDFTIHGAEASLPQVRTVTHLHGAAVLPPDDGYPEAWFSAHGETGPAFNPKPSRYPNDQPATALWYHDHALGITRLNNYAGLSGLYLIRDEIEDALGLPAGEFEIPLVLQDRLFKADGSLLYPKAVNGTHPIWIQEFFGDHNCVNGQVAPFLEVEPRKYRFRLLNAANARFYHLRLYSADAAGKVLDSPADVPVLVQIGTDGGLLPAPIHLGSLLISPAERFDVVIDFADFAGQCFVLTNDAPAPYTMGGQAAAPEVMLFKVTKPLSSKDASRAPDELAPFIPLNPAHAERERVLWLSEQERKSDGYVIISLLGNARWHEPITEDPRAGSTEIWTFANTTGDVHPIHVHLVRFQVLNRQAFDVQAYQQTGKLVLTGYPIPVERNERPAWKDTIKTYPGYVTRVIQRFDLPTGTAAATGDRFRYVWHCHVLEHEDNEMMRPYDVIA
ncbi:MAG TPA: multicopper oxidase [Acidobacteriaceae bacterium]|jgi:spore coat protein A|nr:multicopper oxidase [Acidobacteriaceae bacterium]